MGKCETCTYRYHDGFCMQNLYYTNGEDSCSEWTDKALEFKKERVYDLCCKFNEIYEHEQECEKLKEKYPDDFSLKYEMPFMTWCLNDLHREMSLWKTRR